MPYTKISPATKKQAMDKMAQGMPLSDVAKMFGISSKTLSAWKNKQAENKSSTLLASAPSLSSNASTSPDSDKQASQQAPPALDFEPSPAPPDKKSGIEGAWQSLKGMLGISDQKTAQPPLSGKLDAKRQQFVDSVTPTLSLGFMALATYLWTRASGNAELGALLAPDEKTAQKIMEPLLRIYARHANFLTEINPDVTDAGASLFALMGYINASLKLYQHIKEQENNDREQETENHNGNGRGGWREYRPAASESRTGDAGRGQSDVHRGDREHDSGNGTNGGYPGSVAIPHLSEQEAQQYAALSRLSALDYQHRARRSGRIG